MLEELNNGEGLKQSYCQSFFFREDSPPAELGFSIGGRDREGAGSGYGLQGTRRPMTWREMIGSISERSQLTVHLSHGVDRLYGLYCALLLL